MPVDNRPVKGEKIELVVDECANCQRPRLAILAEVEVVDLDADLWIVRSLEDGYRFVLTFDENGNSTFHECGTLRDVQHFEDSDTDEPDDVDTGDTPR